MKDKKESQMRNLRTLILGSLLAFYGCADAPSPVAPESVPPPAADPTIEEPTEAFVVLEPGATPGLKPGWNPVVDGACWLSWRKPVDSTLKVRLSVSSSHPGTFTFDGEDYPFNRTPSPSVFHRVPRSNIQLDCGERYTYSLENTCMTRGPHFFFTPPCPEPPTCGGDDDSSSDDDSSECQDDD